LLRKQLGQWRESQHQWLELKIKSIVAEPVLFGELEKRRALKRLCNKRGNKRGNERLKRFLSHRVNTDSPELTEVALATLLKKEGISYRLATYDDLHAGTESFERDLAECEVVFASSTFLRDLSELLPMVRRLKRPHNRVVVGGALAGTLVHSWQGDETIDVVAVGYGEFLVPVLADWIKSGFERLSAPATGRMEKREKSVFVYSGVPSSLSLDFIEPPDWRQSEIDRGRRYSMINYESVRGCPYRCSFCNYPFLFDDTKFRVKSAAKMASDWERYRNELGVEYITCLDSLFTMPKKRLMEFCDLLIEKKLGIKWICYARADDLCDESVVLKMIAAGAVQVQIGIESGDPGILKNMNKRTSPEINRKALENCRKHGLTTVATLIVGFPGETQKTLETTYEFLKASPPDFFFIATFSTRAPGVPILSAESKARFDLVTMNNLYTISPYWSHGTMDCKEATRHTRWLHSRLIENRVSLDAAIFYKSILVFEPGLRDELLALQGRAWSRGWLVRGAFDLFHVGTDFFFERDLRRFLKTQEAGYA
jgi:radical SAM superfamily enzyme YgiQ (UPF0313 family)